MEILTPEIGHKRIDALLMEPGTVFWDHKKDIWIVTDKKRDDGVMCVNLTTNATANYPKHCGGRVVNIQFDTIPNGGQVEVGTLNEGDVYIKNGQKWLVLTNIKDSKFLTVVCLDTGELVSEYSVNLGYPCSCKGIMQIGK